MTRLINYRKILLSAVVIAFVSSLVFAGTQAFFSDTETSTGNTFSAGDIDLQIDNTSYVTNSEGVLVASDSNTWTLTDLTDELFFSFADVKPGDIGEDTISIHAGSNDAYACMALDITATPENSLVEPEEDAGDIGPADGDNGELQNYLEFAWWADDGDNVFESDEELGWSGKAGEMFDGSWQRIVDSTGGFFDDAIEGDSTVYIAKAWCFGELTQDPVEDGAGTPVERGTGFVCDGAGDGDQNDAQTDGVTVDVSFYAVQTRNNDQFQCSSLPPFVGEGGEEEPEGEVVGALLSAYTAPDTENCNAIVGDPGGGGVTHSSIQAAIDDEAGVPDGSIICVDEGSYSEFVVDRPLTIAGLVNPSTSATVNPSGPGVTQLALVTSDDVTITGLHFDGNGTSFTGSQTAGILIDGSGSNLNNVHITYNLVEDLHATNENAASKGIQWHDGSSSGSPASGNILSNSSFMHNQIGMINSDSKGGYGIQTVGAMSNMTISYNTISDVDGSWGAGIAIDAHENDESTDVDITRNHIMDSIWTVPIILLPASVQIERNVDQTLVHVNQNNIEGLVHGGGGSEATGADVDAENNWWGDNDPSDAADTFGPIDYIPSETSAFPQN